MEEMQDFQHIILYFFKKGKNATKIQKKEKDLSTHGESAVTNPTCQKWFTKFLGTTDILAKWCFAVGLSHALEDV